MTRWEKEMTERLLSELREQLQKTHATFERKLRELETAASAADVFMKIVGRQDPPIFTGRFTGRPHTAGGKTGFQVFPNAGGGAPGRFSAQERAELLEKLTATGELCGRELEGGIFLIIPE